MAGNTGDSGYYTGSGQFIVGQPQKLGTFNEILAYCRWTTIDVTNLGKNFSWKDFGLNLHFPKNCLPSGTTCTIHIEACVEGNYTFPEGSYPISAVYWFHCIPKSTFSKPVTLEIQHCAKKHNVHLLSFVQAESVGIQNQAVFSKSTSHHGIFPRHSSYGFIQQDSLSGYCISQDNSEERQYFANIYYLPCGISDYEVHFVVVWNTKAHCSVLEKYYCGQCGAEAGPGMLVEFESDSIQLVLDQDIPKQDVDKAWKIELLSNSLKILKKDVDTFKMRNKSAICRFHCYFSASVPDHPYMTLLNYKRVKRNDYEGLSPQLRSHGNDSLLPPPLPPRTYKTSASSGKSAPNQVHSVLSDQLHERVTAMFQHCLTKSLYPPYPVNPGPQQLNTLLVETSSEVAVMWEQIGTLLGISVKAIMQTIPESHRNSRGMQMDPLWSVIICAIEKSGHHSLAQIIKSMYIDSTAETYDIEHGLVPTDIIKDSENILSENEQKPPPLPPKKKAFRSKGDTNKVMSDSEKVFIKSEESPWFNQAKSSAGVPFLYHEVLECGYNGMEYTNEDHDITLKIPEGAVAKGKKIHFEFAVAMYGPFNFSINTQPISPIVWLCLLEENTELKKPFVLILPHFLTELTTERLYYHQVRFAKANHNRYVLADNQIIYHFNPCKTHAFFASNGCKSYGILKLNHCCFYCLEANVSCELATDAGYCLARIESFSSPNMRNEVNFIATFFLNTCIKALEEQFTQEDAGRIHYNTFKFKDTLEPCIKLIPQPRVEQCNIALQPNPAEILASEINFWKLKFNFEELKLRHKLKLYPPRMKMTVMTKPSDHNLVLPVHFEGCSYDSRLNLDLIFPLGFPQSPDSLSTASSMRSQSSSIITSEKPELSRALKELYPLAAHWKTIGGLLGIEKDILDKIQRDEVGVNDCLHDMLAKWLKQTDPQPTWKDITDAVEVIDEQRAQRLRQRSASMGI